MSLLRRPLVWLVVLDLVAVTCLVGAGAAVVASRLAGAAGHPRSLAELPAIAGVGSEGTRAPVVAASPARAAGPTPGLAASSGFLAGQLRTINRDESAWERAEWTIAQAVLAFARAYVDEVVLPGVRAASGR